jgi:hypothetical protein
LLLLKRLYDKCLCYKHLIKSYLSKWSLPHYSIFDFDCELGPGCSSIGYGAVVEIGPLLVNKNGEGLLFNPNSWNQGLYTLCFLSIFGLLSIHTHVWISMFVSNYCWKKNNDLAYMKIVNLCRSKFIICGVPCWSWFFLYKHFFWSNHFRGSFCGYVFFVHKIR